MGDEQRAPVGDGPRRPWHELMEAITPKALDEAVEDLARARGLWETTRDKERAARETLLRALEAYYLALTGGRSLEKDLRELRRGS